MTNAKKKYSDLSSLALDLGFTGKELYTVSNAITRYYLEVAIPKSNGETRTLHVPSGMLKMIQTSIARVLLPKVPVSRYACAYKPGASAVKNAMPHVGAPIVLKLDIRKFFDHIIFPIVKEKAFPEKMFAEKLRILLTILCIYKEALPQGSPASPGISNIIMRDFDDKVGGWCAERGIAYTRYCDDMTFSGDFDPKPVKDLVRNELRKMGFFLNDAKTVVAHDGMRKQVCGIVVNERPSVPKDYIKKIRQEIYYIRRYGLASHLKRTNPGVDPVNYINSLSGRIRYSIYVSKASDRCADPELSGYLDVIKKEMDILAGRDYRDRT
ncbi:MAG: RNA-directed DNA polymerase [Clostridia bacterium]|nr:RNA-directed DNA polymerase [Clostridia bacterium]